ncbi:MAG: hypothetical protein WDZ30_04725 [Cellvibrionaceae bacterium]
MMRNVGIKVLPRSYRALMACLVLPCFAPNALAYVGFWEEFEAYNSTWDGQGIVELATSGCIVSSTANNEWTVAFGGGNERDYRLQIASPFTLNNGSFSLPVGLTVTDLHGSGTQTLQANQYSSALTYNHYCATQGHNAELTMTINQADLYAVPAGTYTASFSLMAQRIGGGGGSDSASDTLGATLVIPQLIQVSGIDNINMGNYDGLSASVNQNEPYCIYTNAGDYTVTPSSTVGSSAGSYALSAGADQVEYTVRVSNTSDASNGTLLDNGETSQALSANQSAPLSPSCSGSDNAAVYVEILGSELQAKPAGTYTGTLTLQVAPI